ncbi:hypothetical protein WMY93_016137 [Mugilogobius chulae]|uniref:Protein kinase domain-containing protein n=1 Tax=Mugilogobius chulae TaxID=88201 RepID=A0AAW0NZ87_9GOBI
MKDRDDFEREVFMLQQISCLDPDEHNVVRFNKHFKSSAEQYYIEFEKLDKSLHDFMGQRDEGLPLNDIRPIAKQLLIALESLRGLGIVHTDIKPDNIMLVDHEKEPFRVKLIDFGLAKLKSELTLGMEMQALAFRAPEVSLGLPLSEAVDMWGLGCCLLSFYLNTIPFDPEGSYDNLMQISHILGIPDEQMITQAQRGNEFFIQEDSSWRLKTLKTTSKAELQDSDALLDLIQKMLTMDPETRITPSEALEHPFITRNYVQMNSESEEEESEESDDEQSSPVERLDPKFLYDTLEVLGEGSFGEVSRCYNKLTGQTVAVKKTKHRCRYLFDREVFMLQQISCLDPDEHNLVRFNKHFKSNAGHYYIEFEKLDQSLYDFWCQMDEGLPLNDIRPIAKQLLIALESLRGLGVVHTDIKPDNIMLVDHEKEPFRVKLIDFGVAKLKSELTLGMEMQPLGFRAPEVSLGLPLSEAVDMWGLGCCLLLFYLETIPFDPEGSYDNLMQISHILGVPDERMITQAQRGNEFFIQEDSSWRLKTRSEYEKELGKAPEMGDHNLRLVNNLYSLFNSQKTTSKAELLDREAFSDLIQKMLTMDPETRITPSEALEHPFITRSYMQEYIDYYTESALKMTLKPALEPRRDLTTQNDQEQPPSSNDFPNKKADSSKSEKNPGTQTPVRSGSSPSLRVLSSDHFEVHHVTIERNSESEEEEESETEDRPDFALRSSPMDEVNDTFLTFYLKRFKMWPSLRSELEIVGERSESEEPNEDWVPLVNTRDGLPSKNFQAHNVITQINSESKKEESEETVDLQSSYDPTNVDLISNANSGHEVLEKQPDCEKDDSETESPACLVESDSPDNDQCIRPTAEIPLHFINNLRRFLQEKKAESLILSASVKQKLSQIRPETNLIAAEQKVFVEENLLPLNFTSTEEKREAGERVKISSLPKTRSVVSSTVDNSDVKITQGEQIQKGPAQTEKTQLYETIIDDKPQKTITEQINLTSESRNLEVVVLDDDEEESTSSSLLGCCMFRPFLNFICNPLFTCFG